MKQILKLAAIAFVVCVCAGIASLAQTSTAVAQNTSAMDELAVWNSVKGSSDPGEFKVYLQQFPDGMFADLARERYLKAGGSEADLVKVTPAAQPTEAQPVDPQPEEAAAEPAPVKKATSTTAKSSKKVVTKKATTRKVASKRATSKKVAKNRKATVRYADRPRVIRRISNRDPIARFTKPFRKKQGTRKIMQPAPKKIEGGGGGGGGGSGGGGGGWG